MVKGGEPFMQDRFFVKLLAAIAGSRGTRMRDVSGGRTQYSMILLGNINLPRISRLTSPSV